MAQLNIHADQLYVDLGQLAESGLGQVGKPLADVYNELLAQAKTLVPEDKLIGTLTPVGEGMHPRVLQGLVGQLRLVLGGN
ncbi:MAG TPA: hypothetical protein VGP17_08730 [Solirubrobacteraceae bacterium]|jgi:hypothetical protein|nr:hypothetical protein [Solirubrobacteraceae bacterium]